jgi:hypothetical protein
MNKLNFTKKKNLFSFLLVVDVVEVEVDVDVEVVVVVVVIDGSLIIINKYILISRTVKTTTVRKIPIKINQVSKRFIL